MPRILIVEESNERVEELAYRMHDICSVLCVGIFEVKSGIRQNSCAKVK